MVKLEFSLFYCWTGIVYKNANCKISPSTQLFKSIGSIAVKYGSSIILHHFVVSYQVELRKDETTTATLKAKGQAPISPEQGKRLAKDLG